MKTKDLVFISIFTAIIFVLEQVLSFVPFFQLTIFLLLICSKKLGLIKTLIVIIVHVLLDNLIGGFNIFYVIFMILGYSIIPLVINLIFKKENNIILLSLIGAVSSLIYCWILIIPGCIVFNMTFQEYIIGDFVFELSMVLSSFVSTLVLYKPLEKIIDRFI